MLAGVGGKTVAEAKEAVSYAEFRGWLAYRQKFGPLDERLRMDRGFAVVATLINNGLGGTAQLSDFLPYAESETTPEDIAKMIGGVANG